MKKKSCPFCVSPYKQSYINSPKLTQTTPIVPVSVSEVSFGAINPMIQTWNIGNVVGMQIEISRSQEDSIIRNSVNKIKIESVSEVTRNQFAYRLILFFRQKKGGEGRRKKEKKNPNFHHMFSKYSRLRRRRVAGLSADCREPKRTQTVTVAV